MGCKAKAAGRSLPELWLVWAACALAMLPAAGAQSATVPAAAPAYQAPTQALPATGPTTQRQTTDTTPAGRENANEAGTTSDRRSTVDTSRATVSLQDVPSEFQRLVEASTGNLLPIFGANLFGGVPSTFAPVDNIPVAPDYVIGPGDELRIRLYGQVNQQGTFPVDRTGDISYPDVGTLHVAGLRYDALEAFLKQQLSRVYRNFELTANLGQLRSIQIFVVGSARRPGAYTVSSLSTLLNALFASGGPLPQGSLRDIQLLRGGKTVVHFDLYALLLRGDKTSDVPLQPGDVIFIPVVGEQVAVTGSVTNPAIYEIRPGTTITQLIELAGGKTAAALGSQVRVERIFDHAQRSLVDVDLAHDADPVLAAGDIVTVGTILDRFKDAVTLRGNVSFPGRYVWRPGMRLTDLVPSADQLITRDYYRRRNALGNPVTGSAELGSAGALNVAGSGLTASADALAQGGRANLSAQGGSSAASALTGNAGLFPATTDVVLSAPDIDWTYATIERLDPKTLTTSLIAFNPGRLYRDGDQSQNLLLDSGDVVTFFSTADLRVPTVQQTRFVRLEGEFNAAGVYSVLPGETLRGLLARAGGFTGDAYLYGSEFTRLSTRRIQQQRLNEYTDNLEAQVSVASANSQARAVSDRDVAAASASATAAQQAIARLRRQVPLGRIVLQVKPDSRGIDALPDLPLEDGDRFVVPRVPSTVSVEGQVYSANSFVYEHGNRGRDYLKEAGGPDREADTHRTFIVRADGSVYSRQYGDVEKATIFPGDTVVVPPRFDRRSILRNVLDVSTVIGQLGIGAGAAGLLLR